VLQIAQRLTAAPSRDHVEVSRDEFRRIQAEAMGMVKTWIDLSRAHSPDDGLLWIPRGWC
jgi:hypothetical protein